MKIFKSRINAAALICALFFTGRVFSQSKEFDREAARSAVQKYISTMTLRQKIGQVCMMDFRFFTDSAQAQKEFADALTVESPEIFYGVNQINSVIYKTIKHYHTGAVILFAENLEESGPSKKFIRDLNSAALDGNNLPVLFCTDQEGGNVNRLYDFTMPSAMAIRRCGNLENAFLAGEATGRLLLDYGISCDFAPVCDISSNPANPVIGIRSFGDDKNYVAQYSNAMRAGLSNAGCIPCAKHFPGHGNTDTDSHLDIPRINSSYSKWKKNEAVPFIKNIQNGIPVIMTAHIQMPRLDGTKIYSSKTDRKIIAPATLSKKILTDILRKKLGFDGVIVTDSMDMQAISDNFTPSESFILAINAGANLICHPISVYSERDLRFIEQLFTEVEQAALNGKLDMEMLDKSVERLLLLKTEYGITKIQDGTITKVPQRIIPMSQKEKQEAALLSKKIQSCATHFTYKNKIELKNNVLVLVPYDRKVEWVRNYLQSKPQFKNKVEFYSYENQNSVNAELQEKIKNAGSLIIITQLNGYGVRNPKNWCAAFPADFAGFCRKSGKAHDTVAVSTNLPYDQKNFPQKEGFGFCATYDYGIKGYRAALDEIF